MFFQKVIFLEIHENNSKVCGDAVESYTETSKTALSDKG